MRQRADSALTICCSVFFTRRVRQRATAVIETAIVLPLYMMLLLGLIYFGFATLGRQRQDKATSYAAWTPGTQQADQLADPFWSAQNANLFSLVSSTPGVSTARAGDTTFSVYGGGLNGQSEWVREGDEYYGMEKLVSPQGAVQWLPPRAPGYNPLWDNSDDINGNTVVYIPYQLATPHQIGGGGPEIFDLERVAVDLWNYALGTTRQSFTWTPGVGLVQQFNTYYTSFATYLNPDANPQGSGLGFLVTDPNHPPLSPLTAPPLSESAVQSTGWGWGVAMALNGPPGGQPWLQRTAVESTMSYNPLFLGQIYQDPNSNAPPYTFSQYVGYNYTGPTNLQQLTTATADCDVTLRNTASVRQGAEEGAQNPSLFLNGVGATLGVSGTLPTPLPDATTTLDAYNNTLQYWWNPH